MARTGLKAHRRREAINLELQATANRPETAALKQAREDFWLKAREANAAKREGQR